MPRLAPFRAAPVSSSPRIGPAQGAHSSPVATPRTNEEAKVASPAVCESRAPNTTIGLVILSESPGSRGVIPNSAMRRMATRRP